MNLLQWVAVTVLLLLMVLFIVWVGMGVACSGLNLPDEASPRFSGSEALLAWPPYASGGVRPAALLKPFVRPLRPYVSYKHRRSCDRRQRRPTTATSRQIVRVQGPCY